MILKFDSRLFSDGENSMFSVMIWTRAAATVMLFTLLISQVTGQSTNFTFNSTSGINNPQGETMFLVSGDAMIDTQGKSLALNTKIANEVGTPAQANCGRAVYKDKVRLRDKTNGVLASFHTSFTFSFASYNKTSCGSGMLFMFSPNSTVSASETKLAGGSLCELNWTQTDLRLFAVEIDSYYNPDMTDVSDSHIGLDVGRATLESHNLCLPADTNHSCAFFCKDSNAKYTTWIDYDSVNQTLQIWFRNGSGVAKPPVPVISYPNLRLDTMLDEEMYVGFIGTTGRAKEVHTIWAWEFSTTGISSVSTSKSDSKISLSLIGGVSAGALAGLLVAGISAYLGWIHRRLGKAKAFSELPLHSFPEESRSYTFKELSEMTKGFSASERLSSGGYGDVYKGTLPSGELVAVKRIKDDDEQAGEASFLAEVRTLRQTRHRNLLQLRGWSYSADGMFLVYEYMCNGSLNKWLHSNGELNWDVRRAILAGVASGLEYLHEDGMKCVLHRDIKSSNVLLDADFNPYLGDFGLARLVDHHRKEKTTMVAGTLGYMAPEMLHTGRATRETDVYAFGVLALEVVTGKKPMRMQDEAGFEMLVDSVWRAHETGSLESVVDPRLGDPRNNQVGDHAGDHAGDEGIHEEEELELQYPGMLPEHVLKVGLLCCLPDPSHRPSLRLVNHWFQSASERMDMVLPELPEVQPPYARSSMPQFLGNLEPSTSSSHVSSSLSSNLSGSAKGVSEVEHHGNRK